MRDSPTAKFDSLRGVFLLLEFDFSAVVAADQVVRQQELHHDAPAQLLHRLSADSGGVDVLDDPRASAMALPQPGAAAGTGVQTVFDADVDLL